MTQLRSIAAGLADVVAHAVIMPGNQRRLLRAWAGDLLELAGELEGRPQVTSAARALLAFMDAPLEGLMTHTEHHRWETRLDELGDALREALAT